MRVLFVANPEKSIFLYQVPMAWALRTAGHEVRFASQPGFADTITQAGLTAVPVGRDLDLWRVARLTPGLVEAARAGLPEPYDILEDPAIVADPAGADWDRLRYGQGGAAETARDQNFPIIAGLVEFARAWRPDLVIWEPLTYAGPIAAGACGAAHARLLFGVDVFGATRDLFLRARSGRPPAERVDPLADWLAGYARKYGFAFTPDLLTGHATISPLPRSLQWEADLPYLRTQYIPYGGPAVVPDWLDGPRTRPRVALTLGVTATEVFDGYNVPLAGILTALAGLDIEVVATVAEAEQAKLGPVPDHVRMVPFVPWHALVPTCAVVIHQAGAATLATTSRHPVPQLAVHHHFDQPILARRLAEQGAGLALPASQATGANVRDRVLRLLREPGFAERAARLRDEIHALPTPNQLVPQLEALAVTRGGAPPR